jgi:hypothetical protein
MTSTLLLVLETGGTTKTSKMVFVSYRVACVKEYLHLNVIKLFLTSRSKMTNEPWQMLK